MPRQTEKQELAELERTPRESSKRRAARESDRDRNPWKEVEIETCRGLESSEEWNTDTNKKIYSAQTEPSSERDCSTGKDQQWETATQTMRRFLLNHISPLESLLLNRGSQTKLCSYKINGIVTFLGFGFVLLLCKLIKNSNISNG